MSEGVLRNRCLSNDIKLQKEWTTTQYYHIQSNLYIEEVETETFAWQNLDPTFAYISWKG